VVVPAGYHIANIQPGAYQIFAAGNTYGIVNQQEHCLLGFIQVASTYTEAFDALLDAYEQIGESIPLLSQYGALFDRNPHMRVVLEMIYVDIFQFHKKALKYFQQRGAFRMTLFTRS